MFRTYASTSSSIPFSDTATSIESMTLVGQILDHESFLKHKSIPRSVAFYLRGRKNLLDTNELEEDQSCTAHVIAELSTYADETDSIEKRQNMEKDDYITFQNEKEESFGKLLLKKFKTFVCTSDQDMHEMCTRNNEESIVHDMADSCIYWELRRSMKKFRRFGSSLRRSSV